MFDICLQPERCSVLDSYDRGNGLALWFTRLWQVRACTFWLTALLSHLTHTGHLHGSSWAPAVHSIGLPGSTCLSSSVPCAASCPSKVT